MRTQACQKEVTHPVNDQRSDGRKGNAAQPRPLGNPRQRYWWALRARARSAISEPRAKAAPRRKFVLRYPTLEYQHEQPSHIPSRVATKGSVAFPMRQQVPINTAAAEDIMRVARGPSALPVAVRSSEGLGVSSAGQRSMNCTSQPQDWQSHKLRQANICIRHTTR